MTPEILKPSPRIISYYLSEDLSLLEPSMIEISTKWRQVQWLASIFWKKWLHQYIPNLQIRSKWGQIEQNIKVDDLVLLMDEKSPRSSWPMGKVIEAIKGRDNLVRTVIVRTKNNVLTRPITKVVLLESV